MATIEEIHDGIEELNAQILAEVEEMGRLTEQQEDVLYNICLRQQELGRVQTNELLEKVQGSDLYQPMIDRELLTIDTYNHGGAGKHVVVNLIVTLKGERYCIMFADEISERRRFDAAGNIRQ